MAQTTHKRDPWRLVWRLATADRSLAILLLVLALYVSVPVLVPQAPTAPLAADRWLSQVQARFGTATGTLYRLGLFSLASSPLPRLLLTATAFLLLTRTAAGAEALWNDRGQESRASPLPWTGLSMGLAHAGFLLLLLGLLVGQVRGWRAGGRIGRAGDVLDIAGHGEVVLENDQSGNIRSGRPGVTVYTVGRGPEVTVRAYDAEGRPLELQRTPREATVWELTVPLVPESPEAYFAVPDAELVCRVSQPSSAEPTADALLRLETFRTPTGEPIQTVEVTEEEMEVAVEETRLVIRRGSYFILDVAHDPGRWLKGAGLILGAVGLLGRLACSQRRPRWRSALPLALALLSLATAGTALWNLAATGLLWDNSPVQAGLTALWLAVLAAELTSSPQERTEAGTGGEV